MRKSHTSLSSVITVAMALVGTACGRGHSAVSPTPLPGDSTVTISGTVVEIVTNEPVSGARVAASFGATTTGAGGSFTLRPAAPPASPVRLTVEAQNYITRELSVRLDSGGRGDLTVDLMGRAPFSLAFFEEFARDRLDNRGQLRALAPVAAPRYVLVTRYTDGGAVAPALLDRVRTSVAELAQTFGEGRAMPRIIEADSTPSTSAGQIVITFSQDASSAICGQASVGVETGFVRFFARVPSCACANSEAGLAPVIIRHELGHTLGAYHVSDDGALMNAQPRCSASATALERFHAAVLFRRPRGNTSPDADPPGALALQAGASPSTCTVASIR